MELDNSISLMMFNIEDAHNREIMFFNDLDYLTYSISQRIDPQLNLRHRLY